MSFDKNKPTPDKSCETRKEMVEIDSPEQKKKKQIIIDEKKQVRSAEEIRQVIKDSKVLYLILSGGWGANKTLYKTMGEKH